MALEFGKRYTWDEIAEAYPDMYAIYSTVDQEKDPVHGVISCVLLDICTYEERDEAFKRAWDRYGYTIAMDRTTEKRFPTPMGVMFW